MDATAQNRTSKLRTAAVGAGIGMAALIGVGATTATFAGAQSDDPPPATAEEGAPERGEHLAEALAPLVEDGTLTQAQADAVVERLREAGAEARERRGERGRGMGDMRGTGAEAVAELFSMSTDELREALRGDATLADLAAGAGVTTEQLVDAMLSGVEEHLAEKVASGDITQEQADERLARATERATAVANGERPERPGRGAPGSPEDDEG